MLTFTLIVATTSSISTFSLIGSSSPSSSLSFPSISRAFRSRSRSRSRPSALCFSGLSENTDSGVAPCLFPLHRCKTIHLVRHAQGIHNVEGDKNYDAYLNPAYFDAQLTPLGWQQVDNLRKHVRASGLIKRIDLVTVSPLLRTLQTAVGVFGGEDYIDGIDALPLMIANAGNSSHNAISSINCPPIVAVELCREHLNKQRGNKHKSYSQRSLYFKSCKPFSSFILHSYRRLSQCVFLCREFIPVTKEEALIDSNEDIWWKANARETKEELTDRGLKFLDCFANCEFRSMVIVDRNGCINR
ncbi:phosphoglycerate mutase-like protein 1 isoform X4 [Arachis hypogaea]|uniref:phosphoglycerate mutase-like protein 1 isoform X4 n=1 Tax=Arachis hypogaea TaxID=3818 RepID=UPI0010FC5EF6|nr:phosphoglycerate mutase-like protein 1 isoform X3 [Arachis hypogaea]